MVGSTRRGNTLFVPVESGTSGASGQMRAIARFVPSPPSTTIAAQPALRIASAARAVSPASSLRVDVEHLERRVDVEVLDRRGRDAERLAQHEHALRAARDRADHDPRHLVALALRGRRVRARGDPAHVAARERVREDADAAAHGHASDSAVTPAGCSVKLRFSPKQLSLGLGIGAAARCWSRKSTRFGTNTMSAPGGPGALAVGALSVQQDHVLRHALVVDERVDARDRRARTGSRRSRRRTSRCPRIRLRSTDTWSRARVQDPRAGRHLARAVAAVGRRRVRQVVLHDRVLGDAHVVADRQRRVAAARAPPRPRRCRRSGCGARPRRSSSRPARRRRSRSRRCPRPPRGPSSPMWIAASRWPAA